VRTTMHAFLSIGLAYLNSVESPRIDASAIRY
jgi:hypothetical protein